MQQSPREAVDQIVDAIGRSLSGVEHVESAVCHGPMLGDDRLECATVPMLASPFWSCFHCHVRLAVWPFGRFAVFAVFAVFAGSAFRAVWHLALSGISRCLAFRAVWHLASFKQFAPSGIWRR